MIKTKKRINVKLVLTDEVDENVNFIWPTEWTLYYKLNGQEAYKYFYNHIGQWVDNEELELIK